MDVNDRPDRLESLASLNFIWMEGWAANRFQKCLCLSLVLSTLVQDAQFLRPLHLFNDRDHSQSCWQRYQETLCPHGFVLRLELDKLSNKLEVLLLVDTHVMRGSPHFGQNLVHIFCLWLKLVLCLLVLFIFFWHCYFLFCLHFLSLFFI